MNKDKLIHDSLDDASRKAVPDGTNLLPAIRQEMNIDKAAGKLPIRRVSTAIIIAIIAVLTLVTAAYAAYRLFWDPGLQAVKDAGLGSDLNAAGQPTLLPAITPISGEVKPALAVGQSQSIDGTTVTLDWVSLNVSRVMLGFTSTRLPDGMTFGNPVINFSGTIPGEFDGSSLILDGADPVQGEFISYQVINDVPEGSTVGMMIDIPLMNGVQPAATFHFDIPAVPADSNQPANGQQTYSTKVNGVGVTLQWLRMTGQNTTAQLCYDQPTDEGDWQLSMLGVQYGDASGVISGDPVLAQTINPVGSGSSQRCIVADFPIGTGGNAGMVKISAASLQNETERHDGPWDFYIVLPEKLVLPTAQVTPTEAPLDMETIGDLTATLQWAYAESNRVALLVHFGGWQEGYGIGDVKVTDDGGTEINSSMGWGSPPDDPSTYTITVGFNDSMLAGKDKLNFHIDIPVYSPAMQNTPLASFRFDLDLPIYQAKVSQVQQSVTTGGLEMKIVQVAITPSHTDVTLCYQKPSYGDWSDWMVPGTSELQIGSNKAGVDEYRLLSDSGSYMGKGTPPADLPLMDKGRCVKVGFTVGNLAKQGPTKLTLTIPYLEKSMPEVIPDDQLQPALAKLKGQGIEMSVYTSQSAGGGGGGGYTFTTKPAGMTNQEAFQKFMEALGYIHPGPWQFEIQIP